MTIATRLRCFGFTTFGSCKLIAPPYQPFYSLTHSSNRRETFRRLFVQAGVLNRNLMHIRSSQNAEYQISQTKNCYCSNDGRQQNSNIHCFPPEKFIRGIICATQHRHTERFFLTLGGDGLEGVKVAFNCCESLCSTAKVARQSSSSASFDLVGLH